MILDWARSLTEAERRPENGWRQDRVASLRELLLKSFKPAELDQPRPLAEAALKRLLRGTASSLGRSMIYGMSFECGIAPESLLEVNGDSLDALKKAIEALREAVAREENWQSTLDLIAALPDSDAKGELLASTSLELLKSGKATHWIGRMILEGLPSPSASKIYQASVLDATLDESQRVEGARLLGQTRTEASRLLLLKTLAEKQLPAAVRRELIAQVRPWCFVPTVQEFAATELLKRNSDGAALLDQLSGTEGYRKLAVRLIAESESPAIRKKVVEMLGRNALDPQVGQLLWSVAKDKQVDLESRAAALAEVPRGFIRRNRPDTETTLTEWARGDDSLARAAKTLLEPRKSERPKPEEETADLVARLLQGLSAGTNLRAQLLALPKPTLEQKAQLKSLEETLKSLETQLDQLDPTGAWRKRISKPAPADPSAPSQPARPPAPAK